MNKRGRPRTFPGKMDAQAGIRAPEALIDAIYIVAQRNNTDVSTITRAFWMRVIRKQGISFSENGQPLEDGARLTT